MQRMKYFSIKRRSFFSITLFFVSLAEPERPKDNLSSVFLIAVTVALIKLLQGTFNELILSISEWATFLLLILGTLEVWAYTRYQTLGDFIYSYVPHLEEPLIIYDDFGDKLIKSRDPRYHEIKDKRMSDNHKNEPKSDLESGDKTDYFYNSEDVDGQVDSILDDATVAQTSNEIVFLPQKKEDNDKLKKDDDVQKVDEPVKRRRRSARRSSSNLPSKYFPDI